jgi:cell division protein FtsB
VYQETGASCGAPVSANTAGHVNYWVVIYRLALFLLIVLFAVGIAFIFVPQMNRVRQMQQKKADLQEENRNLRNMTQDLRENQRRFESDPEFVERTARQMGMVKPNEVVFKFSTDEVAEAASTTP